MATPRLQYTAKDWATLRTELISRIPAETGNAWTDLNESDPGIALVETVAAFAEILLFQLDMSVNEAQFITAVQRRSIRNLVALIDYFPPSITSAAGRVRIDGEGHTFGATTVDLPAYTRLSTAAANGVDFVTTSEVGAEDPTPVAVQLSDSKRVALMNVVQGTRGTDVFESDGTPDQRYRMTGRGVDSSTVLVSVNGTPWTVVKTFASAEMNSEWAMVGVDDKGEVFVTMGDGVYGKIPEAGSSIQADYVISGGRAGSVGAGKITKILEPLLDSDDAAVTDFSCTNPERTSPGLDAEPIERTKLLAPAALAALFTAKSSADYEALMQLADPAVQKAKAWGEQEENPPNYNLLNRVLLCFTGRGSDGKPMDPAGMEYATTRTAVKDYLEGGVAGVQSRKIITTRHFFVDVAYVHVRVSGFIYVDYSLSDPAAVLASVKSALAGAETGAFRFDAMPLGRDIYTSQVTRVVNLVPGVMWSNLSLDTLTPGRTNAGGGITVRKNEVAILEEDAVTGLVSGYTSHMMFAAADAVDLPVPDALTEPAPDPIP